MIYGAEMKGAGVRTMNVTASGFIHFTRKFRIWTSSPDIGQYAIFEWLQNPSVSNGYPNSGDTYSPLTIGGEYLTGTESCPYSYLASIELTEESEDGVQWQALAKYEPFDPSVVGSINPLLAFNQASLTFENMQLPVYGAFVYNEDGTVAQDVNGNPMIRWMRNSAGQWYPTTIAKDYGIPVLRITRNERAVNTTLVGQLMNTTNLYGAGSSAIGSDSWLQNWPAKCLRFTNIDVQWMWHPLIGVYYAVTYQFKVNWFTWIQQVLDQGTNSIDRDGIVKHNYYAVGNNMMWVYDPQLLDGTGHLLKPVNGFMPPPVYAPYEIYPPVDFTIFGFTFPTIVTLTAPPWWAGPWI